jgi:hypothetical protein
MAGGCPKAADRELLIYVSDLSASFWQGRRVKNDRPYIVLRSQFAAIALFLPLLAPLATQAGEREQNELHREVERGEVRPLSDILAVVRKRLPGDVVKIEVERRDGRWLYEIRVVDDKGRVFEVHVDASNATIERIREK